MIQKCKYFVGKTIDVGDMPVKHLFTIHLHLTKWYTYFGMLHFNNYYYWYAAMIFLLHIEKVFGYFPNEILDLCPDPLCVVCKGANKSYRINGLSNNHIVTPWMSFSENACTVTFN